LTAVDADIDVSLWQCILVFEFEGVAIRDSEITAEEV
jgi:hypothetical protein